MYRVYLDSGGGAGRVVSSWKNKEEVSGGKHPIYTLKWENKKLRRVPLQINGNQVFRSEKKSPFLNRSNVLTDEIIPLMVFDFEDELTELWTHDAGWNLTTSYYYSPSHSFNSPGISTSGCASGYDCSGVCGGDAVEDECGVCGGSDPSEHYDCNGNCIADIDCAGVCGGSALIDECGVCGGTGPPENFNCEGNCLESVGTDCFGVCGGVSQIDVCGNCDGGIVNSSDCDGSGCMDSGACNVNNLATTDNGSCVIPPENYNCEAECISFLDCNGVCGGPLLGTGLDDLGNDECGVCGGLGAPEHYNCLGECTSSVDCNGECGGDADCNINISLSPYEFENLVLFSNLITPFSAHAESLEQKSNTLIKEAASIFIENETEILNGTYNHALLDKCKYQAQVNDIIKLSVEKVYRSKEVIDKEIAGFAILTKLLEVYTKAVISKANNTSTFLDDLILNDFPKDLIENSVTTYDRLLSVCHYISLMSDSNAKLQFNKLKG